MKLKKKSLAAVLTFTMLFSSLFSIIPVKAEVTDGTNLALNKTVTVSAEYGGNLAKEYLTDGDEETRWSTEADVTQWAYVDLGQEFEMNKFQMIWESDSVYAKDYNIYVSNNVDDWGEPVITKTDNNTKTSEDILTTKVSGRYVKLEITRMQGYPNVSCREFKIFNTDEKYQDPTTNVALNKTAVASSQEADSVKAANAVDGDTTSGSSRWGSAIGNGPDWIYVDLGESLNVNVVKVFWENRKATAYKIQIANTESRPSEGDWQTVKEFSDHPASIDEKIVLDQVYKARYVRLYIDSHTSQDPDGGVAWNTVSIYELEVYGGNPDTKPPISEVLNGIEVKTPEKGDQKLEVTLPEIEGYTVSYNGTDFEQVVDDDLTIYQPVVDKDVKVSFKVTDTDTNDYRFKEVNVTIPGKYSSDESDNSAPNVLPELAEWKGGNGDFVIDGSTKIVYQDDALKATAEALANDYEELTDKSLEVTKGTADNGDISLALTSDKSQGLQDEGYLMEISNNSVAITAQTTTGAYWATRTILQSVKQTGDIPCGITRDYPLYEIRGFILDVGRKTFTMDFLKQVVKQMSWYKMNDFQVHLNDNLIPIENLEDPMTAYSAFRLESDVKKGGNGGLNQQDLTSTDLFYTKEEFKSFIKESRTYGVNIVPEIDTPAHSLALTKVRPDLRHGTNGRENDHLALRDKYDESLSFVQSIFDEYMKTDDPVFDQQTTVHVGADEYNADKEAYRKFSDDMLKYVQDTGRTARIWGSLTQCSGTTPVRSENVQMNLWNFGYANMDQMYEQGYDLINCNDGNYYIVPNAGYYYDRLYDSTLYNLPINSIGGVTIPAGDEQMIGGAFAVWNDMTDYLENGISQYDVYDRIENAIPLFGAKLWGINDNSLEEANQIRNQLGGAPGTNFDYQVPTDENGVIAHYKLDDLSGLTAGTNADITSVDGRNALQLNGKESYVTSPIVTAGLGNDLRVKVKRTSSSSDEQILFESDYGSIKAIQKDTGKVGFSREGRDYSFSYELPVNEWVELEFKNEINVTKLYVNGQLIDTLGDDEQVEGRPLVATTMFPLERIGSQSNAFVGYVDDIRLSTEKEFNSTMSLDYAMITAQSILENTENDELQALVAEGKKVIDQFAPEAAVITDLTTKINDVLNTIEYKKADYSRVDKYLALVAEDLSIYTDASINNLNQVINSIRRDLPLAMQDIVDGYEANLAKALAQLELKSQLNINYVDNKLLTASASSYQKDGSNPSNVLDDNPATMWHTDWNITTLPHWIALESQTPISINGLTYVPRQTGTNGNVTSYAIEVSDDGNDWRVIKEGKLPSDSSTKIIGFDEVTTTHVRLVYREAENDNGSAAEIKLHRGDVPADLTGLQAAIEAAEAIENIGYTGASWQNLQDTIADAKALLNSANPDPNDVEIAKRNLSAATMKLVLKVDSRQLESLVDSFKDYNEDDYTPESWANFKAALDAAKAVINNSDATKDDVNKAYQDLLDASSLLVEVNHKEGLESLINKAESFDSSKYTVESWAKLAEALKYAKEVFNNEQATKEEIATAVLNLETAINGLKEIEGSEGQNPSDPSTPSVTPKPGTDDDKGQSAKTGDNSPVLALVSISTLALAGMWLARRKED